MERQDYKITFVISRKIIHIFTYVSSIFRYSISIDRQKIESYIFNNPITKESKFSQRNETKLVIPWQVSKKIHSGVIKFHRSINSTCASSTRTDRNRNRVWARRRWMDGWMGERVKRGRPNNAENAERENTRDLQSLHGGASLERSARHVAGRPAGYDDTKLGRKQLAIKIEGSAIDRSGMIRGCPTGQSTPGL